MKLAAILALAILAAAPSAPRMQPLPDAQWTDVQRDLVKTYARDEAVPNDLRTLLIYPELVKDLMPFERYISNESTLSPRHREILILRTAWLCRSGYEWARHAGIARKAGLSDDDLKRIARGPDERGWDPFEKALLQAADELHVSSFVSDPTWGVLTGRYNTQQAIDAVFTVAEFTMISGMVNSLGIQIETGVADRLPADVPYRVTSVKSDERLIGKKARVTPIDPADWTLRFESGSIPTAPADRSPPFTAPTRTISRWTFHGRRCPSTSGSGPRCRR